MTAPQLDILDSLVTLERADVFDLNVHTGRKLRQIRYALPALADLGFARGVGRRSRGGPGQPPIVWAATDKGALYVRQNRP